MENFTGTSEGIAGQAVNVQVSRFSSILSILRFRIQLLALLTGIQFEESPPLLQIEEVGSKTIPIFRWGSNALYPRGREKLVDWIS
jgi:hypothetical protein